MFKFMGSLQMAVPLLIAIAAVLGWGTLYEARFGTASVQRFIYQSWWFQTLLAFLAVNLATAALRRYPWERKHVPFVLAHIGIIAVLAGGIIGGRFGIEGQLVVPEGESSSSLRLPQSILLVHPLNPGQVHLFPVRFETQAWRHEPHQTFRIPVREGLLDLTVDRYYPNAEMQERIEPDGPEENPAVRMRLAHGGQEEELWLFARDPARFGASWGKIHVLFLEGRKPEHWARLTAIGLPPRSAALMREPSGKLTWVFTGERGQRRSEEFQVGRRWRHPWLELEGEARSYLPRARWVREMVNRDNDVRQQALHVTARLGEQSADAWLALGDSAQVQIAGDRIHLAYQKAGLELPFSVKLLDFRKIDYPGIDMAAGFESDVELSDPERGVTLTRKISMNNPLKYRGYTLFQSSFIAGPVETTVLSVRNDPGTPLVYAGFLIIIGGVATMFLRRRP